MFFYSTLTYLSAYQALEVLRMMGQPNTKGEFPDTTLL